MIVKFFLVPLLTIAATATFVRAQGTDGLSLELRPGSELSFEGTSTLHGFTCKTTKLQATVQVDGGYSETRLSQLHRPLKTVEIVIPVKSLTCGNKGLEENMRKTLKADRYPDIRYELSTYEIPATSVTDNGLTLKAVGKVTVAGKENTIEMLIKAERLADGSARATATQSLQMTDFGIKPPVFMLGTLRTGNKIVVSFKLVASPRTLASLGFPNQ
ncbi:MAG TPA: YceI family protein [Gemmatimonadaceae bacterium]|nr:YceI family protein [Gemmatimonadaceae bacterium]